MYDNKNQSDGAIYTNDYKNSEKQPDWTGKVSVSRDMLKELVEKLRGGDTNENGVLIYEWHYGIELPRMVKNTSTLDWIFHRRRKSQSQ